MPKAFRRKPHVAPEREGKPREGRAGLAEGPISLPSERFVGSSPWARGLRWLRLLQGRDDEDLDHPAEHVAA
jgi:hypothetical protein